MPEALSRPELEAMHAYWRAANYLSVGQIYLLDNPLLQEPLTLEHIKPRLLGHWGTTPGLHFIYVHLNRIIKKYDLNMIYIMIYIYGPGHGGPGMVANTYLEGTYSELYPIFLRMPRGCESSLNSFRSPAAFPAMPPLRRQGPSMKVES
jgi:xylulose-5-phosphate/fructose-6-phosphate phosphoketolase